MQYRELHHQAKHIDHLIDRELHIHGGVFLTPDALQETVTKNYPDYYVENCGWHKIAFRSHLFDHKIILKIGPHKSIENDHHTYKRVPKHIRQRFFARIYWHTRYCLLQEFGSQTEITDEQLNCMRQAVYRYGVFDIKADNLRWIDGELKIIDASSTTIRWPPKVLHRVDTIRPKLPKKLDEWIKRLTKRFYRT